MNNFWIRLPKPFLILAPMDAVTDTVFRRVVMRAARPDVFFTEFTSAAGFVSGHGRDGTLRRLAYTNDEQPVVAQIWGNQPLQFREMAVELADMGFAGIDINTGCPDKSIIKQGGGSGLIGDLKTTASLIEASKRSHLPVSVKTRLGITRTDEWRDWLGFLLSQDIANLTIHLRTRREMSKVPAHYELIPEILDLRDRLAPNTKLTINGDIADRAQADSIWQKYPRIDGFMIGRGIFSNIFAFEEPIHDGDGLVMPEHDMNEPIELLRYHLDLFDESPLRFDPLKRFFKIYVRGFDGAGELREELMRTRTTSEVRRILRQAEASLPEGHQNQTLR